MFPAFVEKKLLAHGDHEPVSNRATSAGPLPRARDGEDAQDHVLVDPARRERLRQSPNSCFRYLLQACWPWRLAMAPRYLITHAHALAARFIELSRPQGQFLEGSYVFRGMLSVKLIQECVCTRVCECACVRACPLWRRRQLRGRHSRSRRRQLACHSGAQFPAEFLATPGYPRVLGSRPDKRALYCGC